MNFVFSFDSDVAKEFGVNCAVVLYNLKFWILKNKANNHNYYDGHYWTYNTIEAWQELFPFFTKKQIWTVLNTLVEKGVLIKGNYNKNKFDRTCWYAFADEEKWIGQDSKTHFAKKENGFCAEGKAIPDNIPDILPDNNNNIYISRAREKKPVVIPTLDEWLEFCKEKGLDLERMRSVYEGYKLNSWKDSRGNQIKNWKLKILQVWCVNSKKFEKKADISTLQKGLELADKIIKGGKL